MTIAQKMYALVAAAFIGLIGLAALSLTQTGRVFDAANFSTVNVVPSMLSIDRSTRAFGRLRAIMWQLPAAPDDATRAEIGKELDHEQQTMLQEFDNYEKHYIADDKDAQLLKDDRAALTAYSALMQTVRGDVAACKADAAWSSLFGAHDIANKMAGALEAHSDYNVALGKDAETQASHIVSQARLQEGAISLAVTVLVAVMGIVMARKIVTALSAAVDVAETVAAGDLTGRIESGSRDEIGKLLRALKHMQESLVSIVGQVREGTDTIATASEEIAQGNMDLSARTESQASSLEETAASMEELTSTVQQNSDNAQQANQLALSASEVAERGGAVVAQVVETMSGINESSKKIVDIISVIDGIAFQTNILALNAAVEAARAGEQGRGFAVVASEVRNLAQRSAAAAKEIKSLINTSVEKVDSGTRLVDQAGATMQEVVDSIRRVTDIMAEINAASAEQSQGIGQVNEAVIAMDSVTQQNAALVEEAAAAAKSMQEQASRLTGLVGVFKLDVKQAPIAALRNAMRPAIAEVSPLKPVRVAAPKVAAGKRESRNVVTLPVAKPVGVTHEGGEEWVEF